MDIEKILKENNVLKTGHFLLTSGLHSGKYFEKFRILEKKRNYTYEYNFKKLFFCGNCHLID
jgi:orotate phosphoribosyltransferase